MENILALVELLMTHTNNDRKLIDALLEFGENNHLSHAEMEDALYSDRMLVIYEP